MMPKASSVPSSTPKPVKPYGALGDTTRRASASQPLPVDSGPPLTIAGRVKSASIKAKERSAKKSRNVDRKRRRVIASRITMESMAPNYQGPHAEEVSSDESISDDEADARIEVEGELTPKGAKTLKLKTSPPVDTEMKPQGEISEETAGKGKAVVVEIESSDAETSNGSEKDMSVKMDEVFEEEEEHEEEGSGDGGGDDGSVAMTDGTGNQGSSEVEETEVSEEGDVNEPPGTRRKAARSRAETDFAAGGFRGPAWSTEEPYYDDPTEWPSFDLSAVFAVGEGQGFEAAAKQAMVGMVPYGYTEVLESHVNSVVGDLQKRVNDRYTDEGFILSKWIDGTKLFAGIMIFDKDGNMSADCQKVVHYLTDPKNRVYTRERQSWLIDRMHKTTKALEGTKLRYTMELHGLGPLHLFGNKLLVDWRAALSSVVRLDWKVERGRQPNVRILSTDATRLQWSRLEKKWSRKDFMTSVLKAKVAIRNVMTYPIVKCDGCRSAIHDMTACNLPTLRERYIDQRARAEQRKNRD
ncbi:unnamed protein product [Rhizoctonia solani]|uniref:Uncharacterized protein n=1 Tax=Rhizoctonia solani TaxID=456999 RepID=A0A8H3H5I6_9AGAM|nr:unnamed protein product [Rhizoctonia solani]